VIINDRNLGWKFIVSEPFQPNKKIEKLSTNNLIAIDIYLIESCPLKEGIQ